MFDGCADMVPGIEKMHRENEAALELLGSGCCGCKDRRGMCPLFHVLCPLRQGGRWQYANQHTGEEL